MAQGWQPLTTLDWKNSPDTTTPLNANNLNNKVSGFIGELDERTRTLDNVKLDINDAGGIVARAEDGAETSEAYAIGTRSGIPVTSDDPAYHNNSKYYSEQVGDEALKAEGYANGKQNGVPVGSSSPYYHNNAEYFKDQASQIAAQQLGALTDVDITTPQNGEVLTYDSTEQKWVNGAGGGGTNALSGLTDVNLGALTDGDQFVYDSASSKWINVPADYELVGRVAFQSGATSDTYLNKLTAVATAALTALQAEGNDVMYQASTLSIGNSSFAATNAAFFNNTDTSIGTTYTDLQVASNGVLHGYMVRSSSTANNSYYRHDQVSVGSPCNNSFTDSTSGTTTAQVTMYMLKFKKK